MAAALLGVDIGTTHLKTVAFAPDGQPLAGASAPTPTRYPQPGWAEFDHDALWNALAGTIRAAVSRLPGEATPTAVAFTGMAEAGLPLDGDGRPLYAAIAWFDRRVLPQMREWEARIGAVGTARITGLPIAPAAGVLRLLWLRDNEPDIFARTRTWLNLPDYAAFRLCGAKATEHSLASRMMVFDLENKTWSPELLDRSGLDAGIFGEPVPSAVQIGAVNGAAAEQTGLPVDLPVCTAGHDHLCAAVGLGATGGGDLFDSIGTAEAIVAPLDVRNDNPSIAASGIAQGAHILPGCHYAISGNTFGGGSIDWARQLLLGALPDSEASFDSLIGLAEKAPAGSGGMFFLPHLRRANPPVLDPASRGAFVGVTSECGPEHFARAVLEGLAFEFQRIQDAVCGYFGLPVGRLIAAGGGVRNRLFMQIKADVAGLPIVIPDVEEAACLGAALAGGVGVGIYGDYDDALAGIDPSRTVIEPDASRHAFYRERYEKVFANLYDSLKAIHHETSHCEKNGHPE